MKYVEKHPDVKDDNNKLQGFFEGCHCAHICSSKYNPKTKEDTRVKKSADCINQDTQDNFTVKTMMNIGIITENAQIIIKAMITIPQAINTRVMTITMTGAYTITMTNDMPRTRTKGKTVRRVIIRDTVLKILWTKIQDLALQNCLVSQGSQENLHTITFFVIFL